MQSQMQSHSRTPPICICNLLKIMVSRAGLKPATTALKGKCSTRPGRQRGVASIKTEGAGASSARSGPSSKSFCRTSLQNELVGRRRWIANDRVLIHIGHDGQTPRRVPAIGPGLDRMIGIGVNDGDIVKFCGSHGQQEGGSGLSGSALRRYECDGRHVPSPMDSCKEAA